MDDFGGHERAALGVGQRLRRLAVPAVEELACGGNAGHLGLAGEHDVAECF